MSVGISIYRMIFKENNEEIDVGEKFTDINQNEESLHDIVVFIITFGIHFFIGIMMVYRVIYILTRNTY